MLREFCETTSFHAIPDAYRANCVQIKYFWLFTLLVASAASTYFVAKVVIDFCKGKKGAKID
jgi:hypothetical protein